MQQRKSSPSKGWLTSKQAAKLLHVHESSIKRWCNLGELHYTPTPGGHRRISLADLISFAKDQSLPFPLSAFAPFEQEVWDAVLQYSENQDFSVINEMAFSWLMGDFPHLVEPFYHYLDQEIQLPLPILFDHVLRDLMIRVGEAWHSGQIGIGEEHFFTQAVTDALYKIRQARQTKPSPPSPTAFDPYGKKRRVILGCAEGEQHQIGSLCLRILLEDLGWDVFYLGANVPTEAYALTQRRYRANLICISFAPPRMKADAHRCIRILSELYSPDHPYRLVLGGSALQNEALSFQSPFLELRAFSRLSDFSHWLPSSFSPSSLRSS